MKGERIEGAPQGGALSPLPANELLDGVHRELGRNSHKFVPHADDCKVFARGPKASARLLQAQCGCYAMLALKVSESKTAVAEAWGHKFRGNCFWAYMDEAKRAAETTGPGRDGRA